MYSKYILPSNWVSLSSNYSFDSTVSFNNAILPTAGNLSVFYSTLVDNVVDYSNNNYSSFILTKNVPIDSLVNKKIDTVSLNNATCVIASNLINGIVSDTTRFLKFNTSLIPTANTVLTLNEDNFFEILFITDNELIVKKDMGSYNVYMAADDNSSLVTYLTSTTLFEKSRYDTEKIKFNYFIKDDTIVIFKIIQKDIFFVSILDSTIDFRLGSLDNIPPVSLLNYVKIGNLNVDKYSLDYLSYKRDINRNNLLIDKQRSNYSLNSNFLNHFQYNTLNSDSANFNFFPLKNHLNTTDDVTSVNSLTGYREYTGLFTGGSEEGGSDKISLNYKSNYFTLNLEPDKTTWFHLPYDFSQTPVSINDANFVKSGAIAGTSPIFSDKIWKRISGYTFTSNQAAVTGEEQTGRWLCSWLSGGLDGSIVWVDRFYNPDIFTAIDAMKLPSNVDYTPEYKGKRDLGITDIRSNLTLEPGVWYAYSHMGKKTAKQIINGIDFLVRDRFDSFTNNNKSEILTPTDTDGDAIYNFNGNEIGKFNAPVDLNFNNFSVSFFATRKNWNKNNTYSILGNYVDRGFSIINNNRFNPYIYHINNKTLYILNANYEVIQKIDTSVYLENDDFKIVAIFRRDVNENIHIITSSLYLMEFNCTGTLVDLSNFSTLVGVNSGVLAYSNNNSYGVIKTSDNRYFKIDLLTNKILQETNNIINVGGTASQNNGVVIDAYNKIYAFDGYEPVIKNIFIYFKSRDCKSINVYNISDGLVRTYINSLSAIVSYNFNELDQTVVLYNNFVEIYDELGAFKEIKKIETDFNSISSCNLIIQDLCNDFYKTSIHAINERGNNFIYSLNNNSYKIIEESNSKYSALCASEFPKNTMDMSNYNFGQGIVFSKFPLPSYNFKIKLYNQLNSEDIRFLNIVLLGETLDVGTHHICVTLDTLEGYFTLYVDGRVYSTVVFPAKKYSLLNIFSNGFAVGSVPFFNNIDFFDFYGRNIIKNTDDLVVEKFKFFSNTLNKEEVRLLYYEKYPPKTLKVNIKTGERNFIETITRTFKHKLQGCKSNLINLYINNSLMIDTDVKKLYESIILRELTPYLPANSKINKIEWYDTVNSLDRMVIGNFSIKNTLTDTGDLNI